MARAKVGLDIVGGALGGMLGDVLGGFLRKGSRRRSTLTTTTLNKAGRAWQQGADVKTAQQKVDSIQQQIGALNAELQSKIDALDGTYDPATLKLSTETLKPTRTGVKVNEVSLLWLPFDAENRPAWQ